MRIPSWPLTHSSLLFVHINKPGWIMCVLVGLPEGTFTKAPAREKSTTKIQQLNSLYFYSSFTLKI